MPSPHASLDGRPLRVLILTDCFPRPNNMRLGVWALGQAQGLLAAGAEVRVVSPNTYIPRLLSPLSPAIRRFAETPATHTFGSLPVSYPRWCYANAGAVGRLFHSHPALPTRLSNLSIRRAVARTIGEFRPDVVLAHHIIPNGALARWIKQKFNIPYVVEDFDHGAIASNGRLPARHQLTKKIAADAYALAGAALFLTREHEKQFPGVRAVPLYMGIDRFPAELHQNPRPPEIAGKLVILTVAGFFERKRIPQLIGAFASIAARHPNAVLRLAGDGPTRPEVDAAIARANLGPQLQYLGSISHDRVLQEMAWCDLFALASVSEPFATVYLEAMSAGRPFLCCSDSGTCEVLTPGGQEAIVVPPDDPAATAAALDAILAQPDRLRDMGRAAHALYESRFTYEPTSDETLKLLQAAARSSTPSL